MRTKKKICLWLRSRDRDAHCIFLGHVVSYKNRPISLEKEGQISDLWSDFCDLIWKDMTNSILDEDFLEYLNKLGFVTEPNDRNLYLSMNDCSLIKRTRKE